MNDKLISFLCTAVEFVAVAVASALVSRLFGWPLDRVLLLYLLWLHLDDITSRSLKVGGR